MLLTGTFPRSLDEKYRMAVPKPLRDGLGEILYVAPGTDHSLVLYPEETFLRLAERLAQASPTAKEVRDYSRLFYAQTTRSELDGQGRVRIPQVLVELVDLEKDVVLLGVHDHLELWSQSRWDAYLAEKQSHYDQIAEAAFHDRITGPGRSADA
ncbi:MAG: division/cell wall cluster transcriptional repressor MraZ [Pirellulales bacterium]